MSRSSKGLEHFFPSAPRTIQQKRSRETRKRSPSPPDAVSQTASPSVVGNGSSHRESEATPLPYTTSHGQPKKASGPLTHDYHEPTHGDIAHEVGSASSTSTTSSVFSANQRAAKMPLSNGVLHSTSLTPLTNIDSSPRTNGIHSPPKRPTQDCHFSRPTSPYGPAKGYSPTDSDSSRTPQPARPQARPGKGEVKGYRITYDPSLDKTGKSKEKKGREAQFEPFGQDVCSLSYI